MSGEVFFPGSKVPFRPINPWGRKAQALRYDGTPMPDGWKSPLAEPLYQVHVLDSVKGDIPIGPKIGQQVCDQMCANLKLLIKAGPITGWSSPYVRAIAPQQVQRRRIHLPSPA